MESDLHLALDHWIDVLMFQSARDPAAYLVAHMNQARERWHDAGGSKDFVLFVHRIGHSLKFRMLEAEAF